MANRLACAFRVSEDMSYSAGSRVVGRLAKRDALYLGNDILTTWRKTATITFLSLENQQNNKRVSSVCHDDLERRDGRGRGRLKEGGDICIRIANSCCCMEETNTTL